MYPGYIPTETAMQISEIGVESRIFKELWSCKPEITTALYYPRMDYFLAEGTEPAKRLEMMGLWAILSNCGFMTDPVDDGIIMKRLDQYKMLVLPPSSYMPTEVQDKIFDFIEKGGILVAPSSTALYDENGRKSQTRLRSLIAKQTSPFNKCVYIKSFSAEGKGFICITPENLGRTYRDDWNTSQLILKPVPPVFNRKKAVEIRGEFAEMFRRAGICPAASTAGDEIETAIIRNKQRSFLVVINHNNKAADPVINLDVCRKNQVLTDVFTLQDFTMEEAKVKVAMEPNGVRFLRISEQ
jgi:hypothetical protein